LAFEEHYGPLVAYCSLLTGQRDVAEDLAMEAFVRSADRLASVAREATRLYLRRAATNLWRNRLRRLQLERRTRGLGVQEPPKVDEDRDVLWHAVTQLPDRQRACIVLRYYEDLSEQEAAVVLGCAVGTVKSQTARALARLRKEFSDVDR
jgi:RNA polymerase sigma factor (sigma-70 family)